MKVGGEGGVGLKVIDYSLCQLDGISIGDVL